MTARPIVAIASFVTANAMADGFRSLDAADGAVAASSAAAPGTPPREAPEESSPDDLHIDAVRREMAKP